MLKYKNISSMFDFSAENSSDCNKEGTYSCYLVSHMDAAVLINSAVFCDALNKDTRGL